MPVTLSDFWPSTENCRDCLITAAESASDALFLAIHQKMPLSRRMLRTGESQGKTEEDLLEAFLTKNLPSGTMILPIVGTSGVGKSHMVRWLEAKIRVREDGVRRHIVRIPRSSSLRRVLELILDTNNADSDIKKKLSQSKYLELNETLVSARMPPTVQEVTHALRGKLLIALDHAHEKASIRLSSGEEFATQEEQRETLARRAHCGSLNLPALLQDVVISKHFMAYGGDDVEEYGVLARIASRCIDGLQGAEDASNYFTIEDLTIDESFERADMAAPARQYLTKLEQKDGAGRHDAIKFLNELVDGAISQLWAFDGFSLSDLFVKIRKELLDDEIELVLLIEDFAALAGIQGSLLDAIISEGIRGDQELCTMRTALAVTEGYLSKRETVSTRADYEWRIGDYPFESEAQAVQTYTRFIAGYLNAARWGKQYINKRLDPKNIEGDGNLGNLLPDYFEANRGDLSEEDVATLEAFGRDDSDGMLFPFNRGVIRQLINRFLKEGEKYVFNPRELIKRALHGTLSDFREMYLEGSFPPEGYQNFSFRSLETSVSQELRSRAGDVYERASAFVYFWGDNPRKVGQAAAIDERVYSAFGLPHINWSEAPEERDSLSVGSPGETIQTKTALSDEEKKVGKWKEILRSWKEEGKLSQTYARQIRNFVIQSAWEHVDWTTLLLDRPDSSNRNIINKIWLPKVSTGNPDVKDAIVVALTDEDWAKPEKVDRFFEAITAMCSFNIYNSWDYPGGEADSAVFHNFFEEISGQVISYYTSQYLKLPREGLVPLAQTLFIGARILNLPGASSNTRSGNILAVCSSAEVIELPQSDGKWWELYQQTVECRKEMLDLLFSHITARQGTTGKTALAYDASLLLTAIDGIKETCLPEEGFLAAFKDQSTQIKGYLRLLQNGIKAALDERMEELSNWSESMGAWFPNGYDFNETKDIFYGSIKAAKKAAEFSCCNGEVSSDVLKKRIDELESLGVQEAIKGVEDAKEKVDFGPKLRAVAKVNQRTVSLTQRAFGQYTQFLSETGKRVDERVKNAPLSISENAKENIKKIEQIENTWVSFQEEES